jgi:hypothetical protein
VSPAFDAMARPFAVPRSRRSTSTDLYGLFTGIRAIKAGDRLHA